MRQDSRETAGDVISMEEYLKKRQETASSAAGWRAEEEDKSEYALRLAELLLI
ncbi:MAG TPA: hypothetical protein H9799_10920 [Candidatus Mediterraneibacter merdipullorum]|nr:hypothetical protein [Candidatus Mediterraneibacter merdipullorum]